jgi:hypothetical protein
MNPVDALAEGRKLLDPLLAPAGFHFVDGQQGQGSGGRFASGRYVRGDRSLDLHFRYSLGLVTYRVGRAVVGHEGLLHYLGVYGRHAYPGFSEDPLDGFRHLVSDLEAYGQAFISGSDTDAGVLIENAQRHEASRPKGIGALP